MRRRLHAIQYVGALVLAALLPACVAATLERAPGEIDYNERGGEVSLETTIEAASAATEAVFTELGIMTMSRTDEDGELVYQGHAGDMQVVVEIEDEDGLTEVEVTAEEGMLGWAPEYAEDVLKRIMARL